MSNVNVESAASVETASESRKLVKEIREIHGYPYPEQAVKKAAALIASGQDPSVETITPEVAAVLFDEYNGRNRDFSVSKALQWRDDMKNGEWKLNHQGIAFYTNGNLGDGQHRMAGCALAGVAIQTLVFRDFSEGALDTIDLGKARNAGDALELRGIINGKQKATIARPVEEYLHQVEFGIKPRFSVARIEQLVIDNDKALAEAIALGSASVENVTVPALTASEAMTVIYLLS